MAEYSIYLGKHLEAVNGDIAVLQLPMKYTNTVSSSMEILQSKIDHVAHVYPRPIEIGFLPSVAVDKTYARTYAGLDSTIQAKIDVRPAMYSYTDSMDETVLKFDTVVSNQWAMPLGLDENIVSLTDSIGDDLIHKYVQIEPADVSLAIELSPLSNVHTETEQTTVLFDVSCDIETSSEQPAE